MSPDLPSHQVAMTVLMTPDMANFSGNVHGGAIPQTARPGCLATCAARYAGSYCVTLSVDQVIFRQAIHVGELVTFLASVNYTGNTSMESRRQGHHRKHPQQGRAPCQQLLLYHGRGG